MLYPLSILLENGCRLTNLALDNPAFSMHHWIWSSWGIAGTGYATQTGTILLDVSNLKDFSVSADKSSVTFGAGYRLGELSLALYSQANSLIPAGTCPWVGTSGHILGERPPVVPVALSTLTNLNVHCLGLQASSWLAADAVQIAPNRVAGQIYDIYSWLLCITCEHTVSLRKHTFL